MSWMDSIFDGAGDFFEGLGDVAGSVGDFGSDVLGAVQGWTASEPASKQAAPVTTAPAPVIVPSVTVKDETSKYLMWGGAALAALAVIIMLKK